MKVLGLQTDIAWENRAENFVRVRQWLSKRPPGKGSLVVLPEMFATGFTMNTAAQADVAEGETEKFLASIAREYSIGLVAGAAMRGRDGKVRNKALVFSAEGGLLAYYAKMRPFTLGGELEHYTPGDRTVMFNFDGASVAPFVCYDLRFPEIFREAAAVHRPEVFVVIANWPVKRIHHWTRLLQARAIENQAYVVGVNRVGSDPGYVYNGQSMVADFHGEILASAGDVEGWMAADLDLSALREYRQAVPFLHDLPRRAAAPASAL